MKIIIVMLLIIFASSACNKQSKNLVCRWKFDESAGKVTQDEISKSVDQFTIFLMQKKPHSDPIRRTGISGLALTFDGFLVT